LPLYDAIAKNNQLISDKDLIAVFHKNLQSEEIAEIFNRILTERPIALHDDKAVINMSKSFPKPIVRQYSNSLHSLVGLLRKQYQTRCDFIQALATDYTPLLEEIKAQDLSVSFKELAVNLTNECFIPPLTTHNSTLLLKLWTLFPLDFPRP
jgi:hypothetical protein